MRIENMESAKERSLCEAQKIYGHEWIERGVAWRMKRHFRRNACPQWMASRYEWMEHCTELRGAGLFLRGERPHRMERGPFRRSRSPGWLKRGSRRRAQF